MNLPCIIQRIINDGILLIIIFFVGLSILTELVIINDVIDVCYELYR